MIDFIVKASSYQIFIETKYIKRLCKIVFFKCNVSLFIGQCFKKFDKSIKGYFLRKNNAMILR